LAVAINSDKSHVNRIECGRTVPTRRTLERICEALALSRTERIQLLSLAGYLAELPGPTPRELERVQQLVEPLMVSTDYPLCLMDRDYRCWGLNDLLAYCWLGFPNRDIALASIKHKRTVEQLLDPTISNWWRRIIVDFEGYARRSLKCFEYARRLHPNEPGMEELMYELHADPLYRRLLEEVGTTEPTETLAFLDHQVVRVEHPHLQPYGVQIWHSTLSVDERFFLSHHVPEDASANAQFAQLGSVLAARRPTQGHAFNAS
jgi:transcriptional regulator with XRE-family HTH domain